MAILDAQNRFSNEQAITASAASENYLDMGAPGTPMHAAAALDVDSGNPDCLYLSAFVTETFATLTSLKIAVQVDDNTSFSSATTVFETEAIVAADLVAGNWIRGLRLPRGLTERYVRLYFTVAGSNATAGKITAGFAMGEQSAMVTGV